MPYREVKWGNIYISPDLTITERDKEKKMQEEIKERWDAGEKNLFISERQILIRPHTDVSTLHNEAK